MLSKLFCTAHHYLKVQHLLIARVSHTITFDDYLKHGNNTSMPKIGNVTHTLTEVESKALVPTERDLINYPRPVRHTYPAKVCYGFIPESWFGSFYNKTGFTGPYIFAGNLFIFLCSKEMYVLDHNYYTGISVAITAVLAIKNVGPQLASTIDKEIDRMEAEWNAKINGPLKEYEDAINSEQKEQWHAMGQKKMFDAKREQMDIILESEYRQRVMEAYNEVKHRLDKQVERDAITKKALHRFMVPWVLKWVYQALTPQFLDKHLSDCISNLVELMSQVRPISSLGFLMLPQEMADEQNLQEGLLQLPNILNLYLGRPLLLLVYFGRRKHRKLHQQTPLRDFQTQ